MPTASIILIKAYLLEMASEDYVCVSQAVAAAMAIDRVLDEKAAGIVARQSVFELIREDLVRPVFVGIVSSGGIRKRIDVSADAERVNAELYRDETWKPVNGVCKEELCLDITEKGRDVFSRVFEQYAPEVYARMYPKRM